MSMPFGMIFAIFLIVVFLVVAFTVGKSFLNIGKCSGVGLFYEDLQSNVDNLWHSQSGDSSFKIKLPSGIKKVCFADLNAPITDSKKEYDQIKIFDLEDANVFLIPPRKSCDMEFKLINHINISEITKIKNPYCIETTKELKLKKEFFSKTVTIS